MSQMTGGELVVRQLKKEGVEVIFALTGGHICHVYEASDRLGMKIIDVRHEAAAAHMAEAYGRITRRPGVCLVTAGPGFTNCLTGVQNARLACSPMVVISGRYGVTQEERLALQEMSQVDTVRPMTKWAATVHQVHRIPEFISIAYRHAAQGRPGPAFLEIPFELIFSSVPSEEVAFPENNSRIRPVSCDEGAVEEAIDLLHRASRPVIVAGSGAYYGRAGAALTALIEATHIPLFTQNCARGLVPDSHPDCYGHALYSLGAAAVGVPTADVVLLLGTRLSMWFNFGRPPMMHPECRIIQVDIEPTEIGRNRDVTLGVVGDAGSFCTQARKVIQRKKVEFHLNEWTSALSEEIPKGYANSAPFIEKDTAPIHPLRLCAEIDRFLGDKGIVVADGGDTQTWMPSVRKVEKEATYLDSGLFGCLGVGFPFAVCAKFLRPEEPVVLFNGDGSMGFNVMEFDTAVRHKLPIIVVVNNDLAWGMIKHGNELAFGKDVAQGSELGLVRYDRIAESLGGYGELVRTPDQIAGALRRAAAQKTPSLINVLTDTHVLSPGTMALTMVMSEAIADFRKR